MPRGAFQPDTNLVLAGTQLNGPIGKFSVARYITSVPGSSGGGVQGPFGGVLGTQASGGGSGLAGILIGRAQVRRGRRSALVRLRCVRTVSFCRGRLLLRMKRRVGHRLRRFKVASAKFNVNSGKTGRLRLRLSRRARHVLVRQRLLRTAASAKAKDAAGHTYRDSVGLTLKLRKRRRGH